MAPLGFPTWKRRSSAFISMEAPRKGSPTAARSKILTASFSGEKISFRTAAVICIKRHWMEHPENKATWRYIGDDPSLYERCYLKQTNEEEADWSDIVQFCKALSETETWDDDYLEQVYSVLNTDEFLLWMAVSRLCGALGFALYRSWT